SMTQVVDRAATATAVTSNFNPSVQFLGVTLTATVSGAVGQAGPSGNVEFRDGTTVLGTGSVANGVASYVATFTVAGNHSITAAYVGDGNYLGSTSPAINQVVLRATTTVVTSNRVPSANPGQSITFTATVRPVTGTGNPTTGVVQFREGPTVLGNGVYIGNGRWTYSTTTLPAGSHTIIASFLGSGNYAASEGTYVQVVNQFTTTTTITSSVNPSRFGQTVTFTARVQPNPGSGDVAFTIDGTPAGSFPMDATGRARMPINSLSVNVHSIVASYAGSANYGASTSAAFNETVNKSNSRATIATSGSPVAFGSPVTFTVTVTAVAPGAGMPSGDVQFFVDNVLVDTQPLVLGQAASTQSNIARGRHTVRATYLGGVNFNLDASNNITQRIN
ncbi:MAG TPA: Ig-like domain-containing protein, partial [Ilumatobacteraceae bacterium]